MSSEKLDAIRERDAQVIARLGDPVDEALLRAEMDRQWLLERLDRIELLCVFWDGISKGETSTTRQIRAAILGSDD